ncbi:MAG: hypothetical protein KJN92_07225, partial [Gemmatimonadetes bacterium]|nr:hypothetical protein [Gemmatimonadota bacterium]
ESMPGTPGPVRDYSLLPDGTVIGVGADGLALAWRAKGFALESVPAEAENSSLWGVAATKEGLVNAIGDRVVLERDSTGRWSTVRGLPERRGWVGLGFAVALNGDLVVSEGFSEQRSTTGILVWGRSPEEGDDLPMARLSWPETGLARAGTVKIHMLPDGRFVAGAGFPEEPGVGGYLHVWRPPIREDHFERVDLPHHMDITDLDDNGEYLYVAGGSGIVRIPLDSLPFAETAKH